MHMRAMTNSHVTWLIRVRADSFTCDKTHSYACHDYFTCVPWLIHTRAMTTWYAWHDLFVCVPWLLHVRDMTTSYAWHDLFVCMPWLLDMRDMTHSYVVKWRRMYDMMKSFVCVIYAFRFECGVKELRFECGVKELRFECGVILSHRYAWHDWWVCECIRQCVV